MTTTQERTIRPHSQPDRNWPSFIEEDIQLERQLICLRHSPLSQRSTFRERLADGYFLAYSDRTFEHWLVAARQVDTASSLIRESTSACFIPRFTLKDVAESRGVNRCVVADSVCMPVDDQIALQARELQDHSQSALRDRLVEDRLVENLCGQIVENCLKPGAREPSPRRGLTEPFVDKVLNYVSDRLAFPIRMAELAELASMNRFHFCRMFKRAIGVSPSIFVTHQRLRTARRRLLEHCEFSVPLAKIAFDCGFADQAHLTRHFRSYFGTTPGRFRDA